MINIDWIVVPGGPGLSSKYLNYALPMLLKNYKLHFYNPLGSPESKNIDPNINELIEQINQVAYDNNFDCFGLITHSFGNYIGLRALEKNKKIKALIMLNPIPFKFSEWKNALSNIVKNIPKDVLEKINELADKPESGAEIFKIIYPYYIANKKNGALPVEVPFDANACNRILAKLKNYNDIDYVNNLNIPTIRIVGEKDAFYSDKDILNEKTIVIPNTGHYPFFENPRTFVDAIEKGEKIICHQTTLAKKRFCLS